MLLAGAEAEWAPSFLGGSEEIEEDEEGRESLLSAAILASQTTAREEEALQVPLEMQLTEALQASRVCAGLTVLPATADPPCVCSLSEEAASPSALDMTVSQRSTLLFPGMEADEEKAVADLQASLSEREREDRKHPGCHGTSSAAVPFSFDMATPACTQSVRLDQDIFGDHAWQPDVLDTEAI